MAGDFLLAALRKVWATLGALKIDMALMGGIAVAAWNHAYLSQWARTLHLTDDLAEVWREAFDEFNPPPA